MKWGEKNVEDLTNNIMAKVFTDELASNFTMQGKQKKKALLDFKVTSYIIGKYLFLIYLKSSFAILYTIESIVIY
jgi:hypothetical protein